MRILQRLSLISYIFNIVTFGPIGWLFCARVYWWKLRGLAIGWAGVAIIDTILFDRNHCKKCYKIRNKPLTFFGWVIKKGTTETQ